MEPEEREALSGRRRIWDKRGNKAFAADLFDEAYTAFKNSRNREKTLLAGLRLVAELERVENYQGAFELAKQLREDYPAESSRLLDLTRLSEKRELAQFYHTALTALEAGDRAKAIEFLQIVIDLEPSFREATRYLHVAVTHEDVALLRAQLDEKVRDLQTLQHLMEVDRQRLQSVESELAAMKALSETEQNRGRSQTISTYLQTGNTRAITLESALPFASAGLGLPGT